MSLLTKVDEYKALLDLKDELADETKANNIKIEKTRQELADMMIAEECDKINRSGYTYALQYKTRYQRNAAKEDELFELLRENDLGDIIKETVNAQTLQGTMSNIAEEHDGELPQEWAQVVRVYEHTDISKRKDTVK